MNNNFTTKEMENIFEIGRIIQGLIGNEEIEIEDSKEAFAVAMHLAVEFEKIYNEENDYILQLYDFATDYLLDNYGLVEDYLD